MAARPGARQGLVDDFDPFTLRHPWLPDTLPERPITAPARGAALPLPKQAATVRTDAKAGP